MSEHVPSADNKIPMQRQMKIVGFEEPSDIISEHLTRDDKIGLGRNAILDEMWYAKEAIDQDKEPSWMQKMDRLDREFKIEKIRRVVNKLSPEQAKYILEQMEGAFVGNTIFGDSDPLAEGNSLGERLMRKEHGKYIIGDNTVLNFAEWYMGKTLEKQRILDSEIDQKKLHFENKIRLAVENGWVPERAIANLQHIKKVDVLYDDMFNTRVHNWGGWYQSYQFHPDMKPTVALSPAGSESEENDHLTHELTHALSNDDEEKYHRWKLFTHMFGKHGATVLNEALTEHLAQSLTYGYFDTVNPYVRENDTKHAGTYVDYRIFLNALANYGNEKIDIRDFYETLYFSRQDKKLSENEGAQQLLDKIKRAFPGIDIVKELQGIKKGKGDKEDADLEKLIDKLYEFKKRRDARDEEFFEKLLRHFSESDFEDTDSVK